MTDPAPRLLAIQAQHSETQFRYLRNMDSAILGLDEHKMRLIYSATAVMEKLLETMHRDEAEDYFEHNVMPLCAGGKSPIMCEDRNLE